MSHSFDALNLNANDMREALKESITQKQSLNNKITANNRYMYCVCVYVQYRRTSLERLHYYW